MKKSGLLWASIAGAWLTLYGCTLQSGERQEETVKEQAAVAVNAAYPIVSDITEEIDAVGMLSPKYEVDIKSEYLGVVTDVYVTEGMRVTKGTLLARLDTRERDAVMRRLRAAVDLAKANRLEAEAAASRAEREAQRGRDLKQYGLITQKDLDEAESGREAALARVDAARAQLRAAEEDVRQGETNLEKSLIRTPMDGVIALRAVNAGDLVGEAGTQKALFRIVDNRLLDLVVRVPSYQAAVLRKGQRLVFSVDPFPGKTFRGHITSINPTVNELDRSIRVIAEVQNVPEVLRGGLFVQGTITAGTRQGVLLVPKNALATWDVAEKRGGLFVAEEGVARYRSVRTGIVSGDMVEISQGLSPKEMIITRGGFAVQDGDRVRVLSPKKGA